MAVSSPPKDVTTERIRSAAKHLEQDTRRVQADLTGNSVFFKIVAEDLEKENDSEAVEILRQNLLEVLECAHRLEYQCAALQKVSQSFEAGTELTDFSKYLDDSTRELLAADPFDPTNDKLRHQFDQAIWNVHHAGEAAPGQEEEDMVVINENGLANAKCPLTGKPVIHLENPVPSTECHHIYEEAAVMAYIAQHGRRRCNCAVPGCRSFLSRDKFVRDMSLEMRIQEQRIREQAANATQWAAYTDLDD